MSEKVVRVKRIEDGAVLQMSETAAKRITQVDPAHFVILENPIVEFTTLPPVQKKSAEVVESKPADIGNVPPSKAVEQPAPTTQTTQDVIKPRGRP